MLCAVGGSLARSRVCISLDREPLVMFQGPSSTMAGEKESPSRPPAHLLIAPRVCFKPPHLNDQLIMHIYVRRQRDCRYCKHFSSLFSFAAAERVAHFYILMKGPQLRAARSLLSRPCIEISRSNYCGWNTRNASLSPGEEREKLIRRSRLWVLFQSFSACCCVFRGELRNSVRCGKRLFCDRVWAVAFRKYF